MNNACRKAVFIDRDGVINKDPGGWTRHSYVTKWKDFFFLPGAREAIARLNRAGYDIVIISNQAGVSKGFFTGGKLDLINKNMISHIEKAGGRIKKVYYCIHQKADNCGCRKPKTGLFTQARKELGVKVKGAYFIGDGVMDVEAGKKAGMKAVLLLSGKTKIKDTESWKAKPDLVFKDLAEAADFILSEEA